MVCVKSGLLWFMLCSVGCFSPAFCLVEASVPFTGGVSLGLGDERLSLFRLDVGACLLLVRYAVWSNR